MSKAKRKGPEEINTSQDLEYFQPLMLGTINEVVKNLENQTPQRVSEILQDGLVASVLASGDGVANALSRFGVLLVYVGLLVKDGRILGWPDHVDGDEASKLTRKLVAERPELGCNDPKCPVHGQTAN
jgi:hypothetical protein